MKIVIVQGAFFPVPPILGGAVEKIWFRLGQEFAMRDATVVHFSRRHASLPRAETIARVQHVRVAGFDAPASLLLLKFFDLLYSLRIWSQIPRDADVIVTNTFWLPFLLRGRLGRRVYVDVQRVPKGQMRFYAHVGCLRANSSPVANWIRAELPAGSPVRVSMVPNPLPFVPSTTGNPSVRTRELLFVGRVHPEKGLDLFLGALRGCNLRDWRVRIVGPWSTAEGGGGEKYLAQLRLLADGLPVEFTGPVHGTEELNACYQRAPIFCYPSVAEKGETFGLAPLEAMAWGCVPVVSALECFQDFIVAERNGVIFDHRAPDSARQLATQLQRLMDDESLRTRLSLAALEVRRSHSAAAIAEQFLTDFGSLLPHE